jgi:hypothetical protein
LILVSGFGLVSTLGEVPSDLIHSILMDINVSKLGPKGDVLTGMVESEIHIHVDLGDPTIIVQSFFDIPTLPSGDFVDERSNIHRLSPIEPWHFPKMSICPVAQGDSCGGIEEVHVSDIARVAQTHPNFPAILPFLPRPT